MVVGEAAGGVGCADDDAVNFGGGDGGLDGGFDSLVGHGLSLEHKIAVAMGDDREKKQV